VMTPDERLTQARDELRTTLERIYTELAVDVVLEKNSCQDLPVDYEACDFYISAIREPQATK